MQAGKAGRLRVHEVGVMGLNGRPSSADKVDQSRVRGGVGRGRIDGREDSAMGYGLKTSTSLE